MEPKRSVRAWPNRANYLLNWRVQKFARATRLLKTLHRAGSIQPSLSTGCPLSTTSIDNILSLLVCSCFFVFFLPLFFYHSRCSTSHPHKKDRYVICSIYFPFFLNVRQEWSGWKRNWICGWEEMIWRNFSAGGGRLEGKKGTDVDDVDGEKEDGEVLALSIDVERGKETRRQWEGWEEPHR